MIKSIKNVSSDILLFDSVKIGPRLSVLIGGNGAGKTTLLNLIESKSDQIKISPVRDKSPVHVWRNSKENHRYVEPNQFGSSEAYSRDVINRVNSQERSEGENVVYSFMTWIDQHIEAFGIYLIDEIDSGLSVDNLNAIACVMADVMNEHPTTQFIITVNAWHLVYVFDEHCISLIDGKPINFNKDYDKFCKFSYSMAKTLREKRRFMK
jgi:predicted ATPase